jgi:hypothetical protein
LQDAAEDAAEHAADHLRVAETAMGAVVAVLAEVLPLVLQGTATLRDRRELALHCAHAPLGLADRGLRGVDAAHEHIVLRPGRAARLIVERAQVLRRVGPGKELDRVLEG